MESLTTYKNINNYHIKIIKENTQMHYTYNFQIIINTISNYFTVKRRNHNTSSKYSTRNGCKLN